MFDMSAQGLILSIIKQDSVMHMLRFYCSFVQDYEMNYTFIYSKIISQNTMNSAFISDFEL